MAKRVLIGFAIGNTIIGEVVEEKEGMLKLKNPMEVMTLPVESRVQVSIVPFKFIFSESKSKEVEINVKKALFISDLSDFPNLEAGYEEELKKLAEREQQAKGPQIIS